MAALFLIAMYQRQTDAMNFNELIVNQTVVHTCDKLLLTIKRKKSEMLNNLDAPSGNYTE